MSRKEVDEAWNDAVQKAANIARSNGAYQTCYDILKLKRTLG